MNINKLLLFIVVSITIYSCGNKLKGKIETRENDRVYLVNTSTDKAFKFTVKVTTVVNDSVFEYKTDQIELPPGDEQYLGNKKAESNPEYPIIDAVVLKMQKDPLKILTWLKDTVINGDTLVYEYVKEKVKDTLHPLPVIRTEYEYLVTGQLEIKYSPQKDNASTK